MKREAEKDWAEPLLSFVSRNSQYSRDACEHHSNLGADSAGRRDDHNRDETSNQAIFNGGDAGFASDETDKKSFTGKRPPLSNRAGPRCSDGALARR
jgi:hypothetical protein